MVQTCNDWDHLFLVDHTGKHLRPVQWANQQFDRYKDHVAGKYVFLLDDDGWLFANGFVEVVRDKILKTKADALLVKVNTVDLNGVRQVWPKDELFNINWAQGQRPPQWIGTGYNFIVSNEVWKRHIYHYDYAPGGDWWFASALIADDIHIDKLNVIGAKSNGRGCGVLFEKCNDDWWFGVAEQFGIEWVEGDVWQLKGQ